MLRRCLPLVLATLAVLATTACDTDVSQDDDKDPDEAAVRAGLAALYALGDTDTAVVAEGECFADALLDGVGLDVLVQAGIVEDDGTVTEAVPMLDVDVAEAWVDAQASCVDYAVTSARSAARTTPGLDEAAYVDCLDAALTPDEVHAALVRTLSGGFDSPEVDALTIAQESCAT